MDGFTYLDIGVIAILIIFFTIGIQKGFIDTVLGLISGLVSLIAAILLANRVADLITPLFGIGSSIENAVSDGLIKLLDPQDVGNGFTVAIGSQENIASLVAEAIAKLGLPAQFSQSVSASITTSITNAIASSEAAIIAEKSLVQILSPILTRVIMLVISVIVTFIVIRIAVSILEAIAGGILKSSKSLRNINSLFGGIAGLLKGSLIIIIVFTIGFFVLSGVEPNSGNTDLKSEVRTQIENSKIAKPIYEINPVKELITNNLDIQKILNDLLGIKSEDPNSSPVPTEEPQ